MEIEINIANPLPVYQQIVDQIITGVLSGALASGDPLPPIRQLARDLSLNHNTVAKAYKQLENQSIIQTAGRAGTFIQKGAVDNCIINKRRNAEVQMDKLINTLQQQGHSNQDITELLDNRIVQLTT